jgi:bifunctional UDP-N-acetylglucosamine pyrophosphorylase/glucosamine-1-phosphate N-acetyltransferase
VHIEENVTIGSGSVLKGPCYIGRESYVGNNTLIREFTSLGPSCVVGYGTELKNCVLLGGSTIGRLSYIGDSVIGESAHLGTGVTTVNVRRDGRTIEVLVGKEKINTGLDKLGAFVGDNAKIGARQVLAPGTILGTGFLSEDLVTLRNDS